MKTCPKCAQSFADGFLYCPRDAAELVRYDLRAALQGQVEPRFLLPNESLATRLRGEIREAREELRRNPIGFARGLARGDGSNRRRRRLLHAGFATAVLAYGLLGFATVLLGLLGGRASEQIVNAERVERAFFENPGPPPVFIRTQTVASGRGLLGGSLPRPARAHGGGGQRGPAPARSGAPPAASPIQLLAPNLDPPRFVPSLVTPMSVFADPAALLRAEARVGLRNGLAHSNSLGNGDGAGIGSGTDNGVGPGSKGNTGDGENRIGGGKTTGPDEAPIPMTTRVRPTILYREKAAYTEEARQSHVQGSVVLSVVFGADGKIHDVRTVRVLPAGLTEKAIEAALRIRFAPAVLNGRPVSVRGTLDFSFALY